MDELFSKLAIQAVTVVGKAAFGMAVNKAVRQLQDYAVPRIQRGQTPVADDAEAEKAKAGGRPTAPAADQLAANEDIVMAEFLRLDELRNTLQQKIAILTPTIDMIQVVCAKTNNLGLQAMMNMAQDLNDEMDGLSIFIANALGPGGAPGASDADSAEADAASGASPPPAAVTRMELAHVRSVTSRVQRILAKIEDAVPYINLALSVSGVNLGGAGGSGLGGGGMGGGGMGGGGLGRGTMSLSLLLNASALLQRADAGSGDVPVAFPCRVYRLFEASVRADGAPNWTWKLEHLRSRARVVRDPAIAGGAPPMVVAGSADGGAEPDGGAGAEALVVDPWTEGGGIAATDEERPLRFPLAALRAMYFTATGRLLNIPDANPGAPVLVLHLDEFVAVEVLPPEEFEDSDSEGSDLDLADGEEADGKSSAAGSRATTPPPEASAEGVSPAQKAEAPGLQPPEPVLSSQLSLLEALLRLLSVEHVLGVPHLSVPDDLLWTHLASTQTPGAAAPAFDAHLLGAPPIHASPRVLAAAAAAAGSPGSPRYRNADMPPPQVLGARKSAPAGRRGAPGRTATAPAGAPAGRRTLATPPGKRPGSSLSTTSKGGEAERTPAPTRALNLMQRFMQQGGTAGGVAGDGTEATSAGDYDDSGGGAVVAAAASVAAVATPSRSSKKTIVKS